MIARARCRAALVGPLLALASCDGPYNYMYAGSEEAESLATIGWFLNGLMLVIILALVVLVVWGALRRRGSLDEHQPWDIDGGKRWIVLGGVVIPGLVAVGLFLLTIGSLRAIPGEIEETPDLEISVTARQWWWDIEYLDSIPNRRFSTANELHVPVGAKVLVHLTSIDVIHSFWVPKLHGKIDAIPSHTNRFIFEATEPGIYWGECAEYCGTQHAHMRFLVVAEPREDYLAWVDRQRQPAIPPVDPVLLAGQQAFEQMACAMCHRIRGTRARGGVAPDLTHFGSRLTIGAGTLENSRPRLQAWIVNAQSLKPGIKMPTLDQFDGVTLNALAAYLESLK